MTDRELLELAAKAAGMPLNFKDGWRWCENVGQKKFNGLWMGISYPTKQDLNPRPYPRRWNPLTDDGDALRLAVKLQIDVCFDFTIPVDDDPMTATRRAIVRAAAEIGKAMK